MTFEKRQSQQSLHFLYMKQKCHKFSEAKVKTANKVEKLNVNKHFFYFDEKGKICNIFKNFSMKILKVLKYLNINRNLTDFSLQ